jgi:hypothetical protein
VGGRWAVKVGGSYFLISTLLVEKEITNSEVRKEVWRSERYEKV